MRKALFYAHMYMVSVGIYTVLVLFYYLVVPHNDLKKMNVMLAWSFFCLSHARDEVSMCLRLMIVMTKIQTKEMWSRHHDRIYCDELEQFDCC